jgi:ribosome maturation factor RimP
MSLIDAGTSKQKGGGVHIRLVVYKKGGSVGTDDCARVHRAIIPRLDIAFPDDDFSVEVSSPGIDRAIKDGAELVHYIGRGIRCYRTDISDWTAGILQAADEKQLVLVNDDGNITLNYDVDAKAKLE